VASESQGDAQKVRAIEDCFDALVERARTSTTGSERFALSLQAEISDFVRMNRGAVRQAGTVSQTELTCTLVDGARSVSVGLGLSGRADVDRRALDDAIVRARSALTVVPEDPHMLVCDEEGALRVVDDAEATSAEDIVGALLDEAQGLDLVGVLARGPVVRAVATSSGRRGFYARSSYSLDWSVVTPSGRAVKQGLAGTSLDRALLSRKVDEARALTDVLERPPREIARGEARAFLAPEAVAEILDLMSWGGFGQRAIATKTSPLARLAEGATRLASGVSLVEHIGSGRAPPFHSQGFACARKVSLVDDGAFAGALVSPRSAREYGVPHTGHDAQEAPIALELAAGDVEDPMRALGDGVWLSNLWYLNYSDRRAARVTGMTRFACLVVEDGRPVAPLAPMRFDDSFFRIFGERLRGLTSTRALLLSTSTYERRAIESKLVPGALVDGLRFTL